MKASAVDKDDGIILVDFEDEVYELHVDFVMKEWVYVLDHDCPTSLMMFASLDNIFLTNELLTSSDWHTAGYSGRVVYRSTISLFLSVYELKFMFL